MSLKKADYEEFVNTGFLEKMFRTEATQMFQMFMCRAYAVENYVVFMLPQVITEERRRHRMLD